MKIPTPTLVRKVRSIGLALLVASGAIAYAGPVVTDSKETKEVAPPEAEPWEFTLAVPGWLANTSGTIGLGGINSHVYMGIDTLLQHVDMLASLSAEVRKGRWGVYGDMLYVKATDGVFPGGLIGKADVRLDQWLADLEVNYRVLEGPRGYLDLRAGVRYTSIYNKLALSPDSGAISAFSTQAVDDASAKIAQILRQQLQALNVKGKIEDILTSRLQSRIDEALDGRPTLAIAPLERQRGSTIDDTIRRLAGARSNDFSTALNNLNQASANVTAAQADVQAAAAAAKAAALAKLQAAQQLVAVAQSKVNSLKSQLANDIARSLTKKLSANQSLTEDWLDPYVGFAGRYNLNKAFYLIGKGDLGGFGVGSEFTFQLYGALGCQVTRYIFVEAGYRYLYTDYNRGGFLYDVTQSGAQVTAGIKF